MGIEEAASTRFEMRASPAWLAALDDWRRRQRDLPARAEAIRRLVDQGMMADSAAANLALAIETEDRGQALTYLFTAVGALLPEFDDDDAIRRLIEGAPKP